MVVHGFPERVITGIKCAPIQVKFVTEDKVIFFAVITDPSPGVIGSVFVDEARDVREIRYLTGPINPSQVVSASQ
ncbi:hypothetical protein AG1IA_01268 [Rhizoctonia solani AG-1 IA]|uniref:Uncharacterized protein n=1 Tax=Thanatephorus cucumeris (strain AG1-IA) TaxID=983506 RepID=L8X7R9_THACA|nr:hypothetical protein AG1IA_01268 [Rhizoctonia solani AG-1 IA]